LPTFADELRQPQQARADLEPRTPGGRWIDLEADLLVDENEVRDTPVGREPRPIGDREDGVSAESIGHDRWRQDDACVEEEQVTGFRSVQALDLLDRDLSASDAPPRYDLGDDLLEITLADHAEPDRRGLALEGRRGPFDITSKIEEERRLDLSSGPRAGRDAPCATIHPPASRRTAAARDEVRPGSVSIFDPPCFSEFEARAALCIGHALHRQFPLEKKRID
jgi:hypothetical protein